MNRISKLFCSSLYVVLWLASSSLLATSAQDASATEAVSPPQANTVLAATSRPQPAAKIPALLSEEQRDEHKALAISLRNQRLLEQQAESRAKQLLFQLQAAEAWAAIQRIGGEFSDASHNEERGTGPSIPDAISRYRLHVLMYRDAIWFARVSDGERLITLRHGDMVWPGVVAHIQRHGVRFIADGWQYQLAAE